MKTFPFRLNALLRDTMSTLTDVPLSAIAEELQTLEPVRIDRSVIVAAATRACEVAERTALDWTQAGDTAPVESGWEPEDSFSAMSHDKAALVEQALCQMAEDARSLISDFYFQDLNLEEMAGKRGLNLQDLHIQLYRALHELASFLTTIEKDPE